MKYASNNIYFYKKTPLSTLYNSLILKGLKFNNFLAKNCKPSIYRALEKRVESQVKKCFYFPLIRIYRINWKLVSIILLILLKLEIKY